MRLMEKGHEIGLLDQDAYFIFSEKKSKIAGEISRIKKTRVKPGIINGVLEKLGTSPVSEDVSLDQLLKRPEVSYTVIRDCFPSGRRLGEEVEKQVEIQVKYEGYIARQIEAAEKMKNLEEKKIPEAMDYSIVPGISKEILCKLGEVRPANLGQAGRIPGMTPAALSLIMVAVEKMRRSTARL